jgi:hypothetical protein
LSFMRMFFPTKMRNRIPALFIVLALAAVAAFAGGVLRAPAPMAAPSWQLIGTGATSTITPSQYGLGWADNRMTMQTPVGALQFYFTGTPAEPVIYWPGRIVTTNFESVAISGSVSADLLSGGEISPEILQPSLSPPLREWQMGESYARLNGLTYVADTDLGFSQLEPTVGVWFPNVNVTSGGGTELNFATGRYRTAAQFRTDLGVTEIVAAPASATSTGTAGQIAYDASYFYVCVAANTWKRAALSTW